MTGARWKVIEIEVILIIYHERERKETLESFSDGWHHIRFMLVNVPEYFFSALGLLLGLFGVVIGLVYSGTTINGINFGVHSMLAGSLFLITRLQAFSLDVFTTAGTDPIQWLGDPFTNWIVENATLESASRSGPSSSRSGRPRQPPGLYVGG